MNKKNQPRKNQPRRERSSIPWRYGLLTLACGIILVVGFFFAARQHFASIDYSIKNSRLKKQIEELETSKRGLILAKEIAMSPAEIKKAAQKFGFREMMASSVESARPNTISAEKPKAVEEKTKPETVDKSEAVKPEDKNPKKEIKQERKPQDDGEKRDKSRTQIARK